MVRKKAPASASASQRLGLRSPSPRRAAATTEGRRVRANACKDESPSEPSSTSHTSTKLMSLTQSHEATSYAWPLCVAVAAILLVLSVGSTSSPVYDFLSSFASNAAAVWKSAMEWSEIKVKSTGAWAPAYFVALYVVSSIFCLPLFGFHTIAGYMYGTFPCAVMVSTCQAIGAAAAFIFARHFVRPPVEAYLRRRWGQRFQALDRALAKETREGMKIVFLIRASPVLPFSVTNYICGCTQLGLWPFLLATWAGVLPGTTSYCSIGEAGKAAADGEQTVAQKCLLGCGVVAALVMVKVIAQVSTKTLTDAGLNGEPTPPKQEPYKPKK